MGLLGTLAGMGAAFLIFIGALIVAGIIMACGQNGHRSARRIAGRLVGPEQGERIVTLCTATIRTVAVGVIGLFIGPVILAVAYRLFWEWVASGETEGTDRASP